MRRISLEDALQTIGEEAVFYHTVLTGASNSRAKAELGFAPGRFCGFDTYGRRYLRLPYY